MKKNKTLGILSICAVAALGVSMASCEDDAAAAGSVGDICDAQKVCAEGLVCGDEGKCVEVSEEPDDPEQPDDPENPSEPDDNINTDPCKDVNCPDGKSCLNAQCIDTDCIVDGAEMVCDGGQMCSKGVCVDDGCQDKVCDEGKSCIKGVCEDTLCYESGIVCNAGATCVKGACVDNECLSVTCEGDLVCAKGDCVYPACVGKEACSEGKSCNEAGDCVFDVAPALNAIADKNETDESGASATISLSLNNAPTANVTVQCALTPENAATEAEVNCESVLFDASNYQSAQTIQVIGLPDNVIDEDQNYTLTLTTVSEDADFNGLTQTIDMVNKNIDTVGVQIQAADLVTTEAGGSAVFSIALKAKPAADVTLSISSSQPEYGILEGATENKLTVTFTPENWEIPQEIKIIGVDDGEVINESEHKYQIVFEKTVSEDSHYNGLDIAPLDVVNLDNDIADAFLDKTEIVTEEGGMPVDVKVRLGVEPAENVHISFKVFEKDQTTPSDEIEIVSDAELTLTKENYKDGVTVSLKGIDDHLVDGDQDYAVQLKFATNDERYQESLKEKWILGKNIDKNVISLQKNMPEGVVSEDGTSIDIGLSLAVIPTAPVTIHLKSSDEAEIIAEPSSLTFTTEDWDKEQVVKVTGVDDFSIDGDKIIDLLVVAESEDVNYGGDGAQLKALEEKIAITNNDNDVADIVTDAVGVEIMENSDKLIEYKVTLSAKPKSNVTVIAKSSDESELKLVTSNIIVFTPGNWNVPQTVQLQVQDDSYADGTQSAFISMTTSSGDADFNGIKTQTPYYSILDNESASVTLTAAKTTLVPGDYSTPMTVALSAAPLSDVVVTLKTTNDVTAALSETTLTFTTDNWNVPQVVTITDTDPRKAAAAKTIETISATTTGTGQYNDLKSNDVEMTLYAFQSQSFVYTGGLQEISLMPGKYKLEVYGSQSTAGWKGGIVGKGGYSYGTYQVGTTSTIYVCVGGNSYHAATSSGGYNGGGYGHGKSGNARGGGATHMAIAKRGVGVLKDYDAYRSEVLIVAGGAGGVEWGGTGGAGGGATGGAGVSVDNGVNGVAAVGGVPTQTTGGTSVAMRNMASTMTDGGFGYGGYGYTHSGTDYGAGGGGGWYGGGGTSFAGAAAGGSGYIGGVQSGGMLSGVHASTGMAKITLVD